MLLFVLHIPIKPVIPIVPFSSIRFVLMVLLLLLISSALIMVQEGATIIRIANILRRALAHLYKFVWLEPLGDAVMIRLRQIFRCALA